MKLAVAISVMIAVSVIGCVSRTNDRSIVEREFDPNTGKMTSEKVIDLDSRISATGNQTEFAGVSITEKIEENPGGGVGDYSYGLGVDSAKTDPKSAYENVLMRGLELGASLAPGGGGAAPAPTLTIEDFRALIQEELSAAAAATVTNAPVQP